jgi:TatD DNase family protein
VIDLHCHLDLYSNPAEVVARCHKEGVYVLSVTTTPKAWRGTSALAKGCPRIRTALGFHPQIAHERLGELPLFEALLPETKYIGEIGLDGSPEFQSSWRNQVRAFDHILKVTSHKGGRVMSIHSRRAVDEVLDALARNPDSGVAVLHWFSGTSAQLERAVSLGAWFSVGPAMLRGKGGRALVAEMPANRVLPETDGPFTMSGDRPLEPSDARLVVKELAILWKLAIREVEKCLLSSFKVLISAV